MLVSELRELLQNIFSPLRTELILQYTIGENELTQRRLEYTKSFYEIMLLDIEQNIQLYHIYQPNKDIYTNMIGVVSLLFPNELAISNWSIKSSDYLKQKGTEISMYGIYPFVWTRDYNCIEALVNTKISYFYWVIERLIVVIERILPVECTYNIGSAPHRSPEYVRTLRILFKVKN